MTEAELQKRSVDIAFAVYCKTYGTDVDKTALPMWTIEAVRQGISFGIGVATGERVAEERDELRAKRDRALEQKAHELLGVPPSVPTRVRVERVIERSCDLVTDEFALRGQTLRALAQALLEEILGRVE